MSGLQIPIIIIIHIIMALFYCYYYHLAFLSTGSGEGKGKGGRKKAFFLVLNRITASLMLSSCFPSQVCLFACLPNKLAAGWLALLGLAFLLLLLLFTYLRSRMDWDGWMRCDGMNHH